MNRVRYKVNELVIITTKDENVPMKRVPRHGRHHHQRRRSDEKSVQSRGSLLLLLSSLPPQFLARPPTCSLLSVREHGWNSIIGSRECGG